MEKTENKSDLSIQKAKEDIKELEDKINLLIDEFTEKWSGRAYINHLKPFEENKVPIKIISCLVLGHGEGSASPNGFTVEEFRLAKG